MPSARNYFCTYDGSEGHFEMKKVRGKYVVVNRPNGNTSYTANMSKLPWGVDFDFVSGGARFKLLRRFYHSTRSCCISYEITPSLSPNTTTTQSVGPALRHLENPVMFGYAMAILSSRGTTGIPLTAEQICQVAHTVCLKWRSVHGTSLDTHIYRTAIQNTKYAAIDMNKSYQELKYDIEPDLRQQIRAKLLSFPLTATCARRMHPGKTNYLDENGALEASAVLESQSILSTFNKNKTDYIQNSEYYSKEEITVTHK